MLPTLDIDSSMVMVPAAAAAMAKMWAADDMVVMTAQRARAAERHVGVAAQMVMGKAS